MAAPPPPPTTLLQLQTTPDFKPNELLKEMGFDISPITTTIILLLIQPCHPQQSPLWMRNSMTSTVVSFIHASWNYFKPSLTWNGIWNVPSLKSVESRNMQNAYMGVLNRKVHNTYRKLSGTIMCECNCQASLKVSQSPLNPGRPFFACRNKDGCRFFQWADVGFTKKNEQLQKLFKEYGKF